MLRRVGAVLVMLGVLALAGCGVFFPNPTPEVTYTDESGAEVTVSWAEYPAHAGIDGEPLIDYPDQDELEPIARDLMSDVRAALSDAGVQLTAMSPEPEWFESENWHPHGGNGYGGTSMLTTVNCCELQSDRIPDDEWSALLDAASEAAERHGLGGFIFDEYDTDCNGTVGCWQWAATATDGVQWLYLVIQDREKDRTGEATHDAERYGWPMRSVSVGYGATVVEAGQKEAFAVAMEPFLGHTPPDATVSD